MIIWITGITASGKTSLGKALIGGIKKSGISNVIHFDGDELRKRPGWVQGHTIEDRFKVLVQLVDLLKEEQDKGNIVIISTVSHKKQMREYAREKLDDFVEVYLKCSPDSCAQRDYKGFYERAKARGDDSEAIYPGVSEPYEESENPELIIHTGSEGLQQSSQKLLDFIMKSLEKVNPKFLEAQA